MNIFEENRKLGNLEFLEPQVSEGGDAASHHWAPCYVSHGLGLRDFRVGQVMGL